MSMPHISQSDSQTLESGELSVSPEYLNFLLNNSLIFFIFFFHFTWTSCSSFLFFLCLLQTTTAISQLGIYGSGDNLAADSQHAGMSREAFTHMQACKLPLKSR